jgi:general secretion pathway protein D
MRDLTVRILILLLALGPLAGCASYSSYRKAEVAGQRGNWDEAVLHYLKALEEDPGNVSYKAALLRAKIQASRIHLEKGKEFEKAGVIERALVEYQQAVQLDPTNQYAKAQLENIRQLYAAQRQGKNFETIDEMKRQSRGARPQPPKLNPRSDKPISMEFPQEVSIFSIYRALGDVFGINILFDPNLKDQQIAIELKDVTAQAALETLMRAGGHFYKVMDEHTIIVAAETAQNRRLYEDLVIQTFFLSNSDVKEMTTILRSLIDSRKIAQNEQLNAIILRDSADKVKVAERIIEANDKAKAEVVIDVELLQVNTGRLRDLGVSLTNYAVGQQLDLGGGGGSGTGTGGTTGGGSSTSTSVRLSDLEFINQSNWILTIPNFLYEFVKSSTEAQLLAKPQLRITDGEKANLVIGDRVPIPLTTFNTQNAGAAGGIIPITSFQYQDVGIRIDIEPRVHHNREVTLKLKVEVSNLSGSVSGSGGAEQPIIGTRSIESTIRLQDGETNLLAGLIREEESSTESGFPGLSEIPILGRLFSNKRSEGQRTDVVLTLTPYIIRNAEITADDLEPIWVGTEQNITFRGGSPRVESDVEGPFDGNEGTPEEVQDAIRRRLQRLPRGLRPGEGGEEVPILDEEGVPPDQVPPPQPPPGVNLVPSAPPSDIFRQEPEPVEPPLEEVEPPMAPMDNRSLFVGPSASAPASFLGAPSLGGIEGVQLAAARSAVRLWLAPGKLNVEPGQVFSVDVWAAAGRPVAHLPMSLRFDPAILAVDRVEAGDFLGPEGSAHVMADSSRPGQVVLGASQLGEALGVKGKGKVARVTFRALARGATRIEFTQGEALDVALRPVLPVGTQPAMIRVRPAKPAREA